MEEKLSKVAQTLKPSPIQELSHLSQRCNAINLAMGFPDFPAPTQIKDAAISAINSDFNQYRHVQGICEHLAEKMKLQQGLDVNPLTDIAICCGQTEAFAAAVFANRGDEVLLFDPAYETYETCILMAGGVPVYVSLDPPNWTLDRDKLMKSVTSRTKVVVLNSPHNPTGKVFSKDELEAIAGVCRDMDCLAITDEVYEYITFDMEKHISLASLLGMQERTIITSSLSKTFSVTGWRIGWAIAPACIAFAIRNIHVKITDSAPAPFQEAALTALTCSPEYYESLRTAYESKRNYIVKMLCSIGFKIHFKPQGSFFVFAELPEECILSDIDFVTELIRKAGVAAVPGCGFFHSFSSSGQNYQRRYIRFAFCKNDATLDAAAQKMGKLVDGLLKGWKKCI
ncbi:kynurenine--oxoglutarate transaminase-like isoform X2 [Telopea speciosissima]|uniref:kynurenine--oxoglutarate transaminase-like isoform X2 n=1 Tax=Telopea speciosissima TaxID=54955 RepID=UPI001CC7CA3C|nr:kynurenine--oxoglutarate transaminase-like isoform X2 [Telopea speciosissima]